MTRVTPSPHRPFAGLVRFHDGIGYTIAGPTDIPDALASRLLARGDVIEADTPAGPTSAQSYDPGQFSAADVVAYAADHPDEVAGIVAAEADGKARMTVLALGDSPGTV